MPGFLKGNWSKAAIGGLVLLNIVLIVLLVLRNSPGDVTAVPAASGGSTSASPIRSSIKPTASTRTPTASPSAPRPPSVTPTTASPTPTRTKSSPGSDRSRRVLGVSSAKIAWRAVFGACPTDPDVEVSRDGGRTWRPTKTGLRSVTRLRAYSESAVFAIGGAEGCAPRYLATGGPGEPWFGNGALLGESWYRVPKEINRVHAPGGRLSSPCGKQLLDFAGLGDLGAAALCADGTLRTTQDSGRSWRDLEGGSAGLALGADEQTYALAMRHGRCDGVAVVSLGPSAGEVDRDDVRCAPLKQDAGEELAVGVRGQVIWLWLGSEVVVSTDTGRSWKSVA